MWRRLWDRFVHFICSSKQRPLSPGQAQENPEEGVLQLAPFEGFVEFDDDAKIEINFSISGVLHLGHKMPSCLWELDRSSSKTWPHL